MHMDTTSPPTSRGHADPDGIAAGSIKKNELIASAWQASPGDTLPGSISDV